MGRNENVGVPTSSLHSVKKNPHRFFPEGRHDELPSDVIHDREILGMRR